MRSELYGHTFPLQVADFKGQVAAIERFTQVPRDVLLKIPRCTPRLSSPSQPGANHGPSHVSVERSSPDLPPAGALTSQPRTSKAVTPSGVGAGPPHSFSPTRRSSLSPDRASPERKPPHEHRGHAPPAKAGDGTGKLRRASEPLVRPRLCQNCKSLLTTQAGPPSSQPLRMPQLAGGRAPRGDETCPVSTEGGTRLVQLVREGGGRGGGGALPVAPTCPTALRTNRAAPLTRRRRRARRSKSTTAALTAARGRRASKTSTRALSPRSRAATGECD